MVHFKNLPIRQKFLFVLMAVNMTTLLMAFGGFLIYDRVQIKKAMVDQAATIADILACNCTAALLFDDAEDARETLSFLKTRQAVTSAWIFTEKGTVLADYVREDGKNSKVSPEIQNGGHYFKSGILHFYKKAIIDGKWIGTVYIRSEMNEMNEITEDHFYIAVWGLFLALVFSLFIAIKMQKAVVNPILELEALSKSVSRNKDYSVRGKKRGKDEIGSLVDAFNEMLHQIEQQNSFLVSTGKIAEDSAQKAIRLAENLSQANLKLENEIGIRKDVEKTLQKHRELLETRVQERTSELQETNRRLTEEISERLAVEKKMQESLDEKVLLLGEIHHRVKNNLQVISSLLDLTRRRTLSSEAKSVLASARSKIFSMALVHSQLYKSASFSRIDMAVHIRRLLASISQVYGTSPGRVHPVIECSQVYLSVTQAIPCALILNELISNVYKHAYPEGVNGKCFISMSASGDNRVHFRVRDEGAGIPKHVDIEHTETLGLKLIRNLIRKQLKGEVRFEYHNGTDIIAEFPVDHDDALIHGGPELTPDGRFLSSGDASGENRI